MSKRYIYSLYDAKTGELLHRGTPTELVEAGLFPDRDRICSDYHHQKRTKNPYKWKIQREEVKPKAEKAKPAAARPAKQEKAPKKKVAEVIRGIEKPDALQLDVHVLCLYNAAARKAGRKELSYGYWAAAGRPEKT